MRTGCLESTRFKIQIRYNSNKFFPRMLSLIIYVCLAMIFLIFYCSVAVHKSLVLGKIKYYLCYLNMVNRTLVLCSISETSAFTWSETVCQPGVLMHRTSSLGLPQLQCRTKCYSGIIPFKLNFRSLQS